jgi:hypothetical protein
MHHARAPTALRLEYAWGRLSSYDMMMSAGYRCASDATKNKQQLLDVVVKFLRDNPGSRNNAVADLSFLGPERCRSVGMGPPKPPIAPAFPHPGSFCYALSCTHVGIKRFTFAPREQERGASVPCSSRCCPNYDTGVSKFRHESSAYSPCPISKPLAPIG